MGSMKYRSNGHRRYQWTLDVMQRTATLTDMIRINILSSGRDGRIKLLPAIAVGRGIEKAFSLHITCLHHEFHEQISDFVVTILSKMYV